MIRQLNSSTGRDQGMTEYYRTLLHQSRQALHRAGDAPMTLGVTSSARREGVSTVASNLAICAARDFDAPTLYIDANLKNPFGHELFSSTRTIGVSDILNGAATPDCIQSTSFPNVSLIAAGTASQREATVVGGDAFRILLDGLSERFSTIIVDMPNANEYTDCLSICNAIDGVLLVVEAERVRNQVITRAKERLMGANANLLGVVFNKRQEHVPGWLYRRL
jgi:capsular exopolysaccharide synthesis family protein